MIYAISDLHGCYEKYIKMLEKISFNDNDILYVLGDVIDRGDGGIKILFDMMNRKNVRAIIGNHESLALSSLKAIMNNTPVNKTALHLWMGSDGEPTKEAFSKLNHDEQNQIIDYIESFSVYDEITVENQKFHLSHTLPEYNPNKAIHDVSFLEFIYGEPDYDKKYADDVLFITGHTPTVLINPYYKGKIVKQNNHIAIDCGAVFSTGRLGCICLDTLEEFYVD